MIVKNAVDFNIQDNYSFGEVFLPQIFQLYAIISRYCNHLRYTTLAILRGYEYILATHQYRDNNTTRLSLIHVHMHMRLISNTHFNSGTCLITRVYRTTDQTFWIIIIIIFMLQSQIPLFYMLISHYGCTVSSFQGILFKNTIIACWLVIFINIIITLLLDNLIIPFHCL